MYAGVLICVLTGLAVCSWARATAGVVSVNPYDEICVRNAFGLRPPRPPNLQTPSGLLPKVTLTGITTILGDKRVLLRIRFPAKVLQSPPKETSCILREGQKDGPIEILAVDEKARRVKMNNSGTIEVLTFEKNGARSQTPPPPAPVPGVRRYWARFPARLAAAAPSR